MVAGSSDQENRAVETGKSLSFPVAYGVTKDDAIRIGAYVGLREGKDIIQPTEILLRPGGTVAAAMYSTSQIGRMDPDEVIRFLNARVGKPAT